MTNIKKNLVYQMGFQIINMALPLVTSPYLSRVLGADALGVVSFTTSTANYFVLFAMLGLTNYGTRSIATVKGNSKEQNRTFSEIYFMQVLTCLVSIIAYCIYSLFFCKENHIVVWIQGIAVLSCLFDINWFFFGIEEFRLTVIRGMIIRVLSVILIVLLVKKPADLWIYVLISTGSTLISQLVLWFYFTRFGSIVRVSFIGIVKHFKQNIVLFIPLIAMSFYHIMDKTMLGLLAPYSQSGYYYNADKIINIPIGLLTGIGTVMLPRMTSLVETDKKDQFNQYFNDSIKLTGMFSAAMCCGIAAIAKEFTPLFFGPGYDECIVLIIVLAPVLFVKGFSIISRNLYLVPMKLEKYLTVSVTLGAIVNLLVNIMLIPHYGAFGAVIGTLIAEIVSCVFQYFIIIKKIKCIRSVLSTFVYFLLGTLMFFVVRGLASVICSILFVNVLLEIAVGVFVYIAFCVIYWKLIDRDTFRIIRQAFPFKRVN